MDSTGIVLPTSEESHVEVNVESPANGSEIDTTDECVSNNGTKQTIYDVLGGNDQELARRQLVNDDDDDSDNDDDENGPLAKRKRLALSYSHRDVDGETGGNDEDRGVLNGNEKNSASSISRPVDENCLSNSSSSMNGYQSDYNNSLGSSGGGGINNLQGEPTADQLAKKVSSDEPEQMRKLFIGGLDYKTSEETLKQHFEKFGDVNDCVVMREPQSKRSRGFGFVIYAISSMVDRAQQARPHEVDGREVQSKRAISREDSGNPEAQATVKKVYLGGLSDDIEESELRDYFKEFGNIVNINIVVHKDTGKKRGFAFVEYDDYDPVDKIVLKKFHTIKDKRIEAKKARPKAEMDAARRRGDPRASMAGAMMALAGGSPFDGSSGRSRPPGRISGGSGAYMWGSGAYGSSAYPAGYAGQVNYGYPAHYHSPSAHYGTESWMMHGGQADAGGPYGFRGAHNGGYYSRSGYSNPPNGGAGSGGGGGNNGAGYVGAADYVTGFPASLGGAGGGPMRLSYQHRSLGPYGTGYGAHRGRG